MTLDYSTTGSLRSQTFLRNTNNVQKNAEYNQPLTLDIHTINIKSALSVKGVKEGEGKEGHNSDQVVVSLKN